MKFLTKLNAPTNRRGQTLPFWVISVLMELGLVLFVFNYADTVRWQIRAQNAADSAAVTLLASDAQAANSMSTLLYALSLQDFKMSTINTTIVNLLQNDSVCVLQAPCSAKLNALLAQYQNYLNEMPQLESSLSSFTASLKNSSLVDQMGLNQQGNPSGYATNLLNSLLSGGSCVDVLTNCAEGFKYSVAVVTTVPLVVDVVACKNVQSLGAGFLHLAQQSFKAVGRATVRLSPLNSTTNAGTLVQSLNGVNGITPQIPLGGGNLGLGSINLANFSVTTGYLIPAPVSPLNAANVPC
jgi:hypothetical protein